MKYPSDPKAVKALEAWIEDAAFVAQVAVDCDVAHAPEMTPIEQIVYFVLSSIADRNGVEIIPQCQIGKYRVDFLVKPCWENPGDKIIVECDGHDFHERTKEQAQRDKKRDRDLQSVGFKVYRFTGSEIWKSDGQCVVESLGMSK